MAREIAFFLRGRPFAGGVNSVVQEFAALVDGFGVGHLVVEERHLEDFRRGYDLSVEAIDRMTATPEGLPRGAAVVATTNDSLGVVKASLGKHAARVYYYVQDYEPLFYPVGSAQHRVALESYSRAQDAVAVVKTDWLATTLLEHTFFPVVKIRPSIDRTVYRPRARVERQRSLAAMVRPATARRGAHRTAAVLNRIARSGVPLTINAFGTDPAELAEAGIRLDPSIRSHGRLTATQAGELLATSTFVLDLSDYQAFGRTVAEGMAAGVIPIVTKYGAPPEFVTQDVSGFLVAPNDLDAVYDTLIDAVRMPSAKLGPMRLSAMEAVSDWSTAQTASDWFALMLDA